MIDCSDKKQINKIKQINKSFKKWRILKIILITMTIIFISSYEALAIIDMTKWELNSSISDSPESSSIFMTSSQFDNISQFLNLSMLSTFEEWLSEINGSIDLTDLNKTMKEIKKKVGNDTWDAFEEALKNGTLTEDDAKDILSIFIDDMIDNFPSSWNKTLVIVATYKGRFKIKNTNVSVNIVINNTYEDLIDTDIPQNIKNEDSAKIQITFAKIIESLLRAGKSSLIDIIITNMINSSSPNTTEFLSDDILPQLFNITNPTVRFSISYQISLIPIYLMGEIKLLEVIDNVAKD